MLFITSILSLLGLAGGIAFAGRTVSRLRNTSATYNGRLLPFVHFSLSSWILGAFQYVILISSPFIFFPGFDLVTGLWLGLMQNVLWAGAVLSLHSKRFSRISETLRFFIVLPIIVLWASLTYQTAVLNSVTFINVDAVSAAVTFATFAYSIVRWRLSKICAAVFFIHGYFQWIWRSLWFTPLVGTQLLVFSLWRISLLAIWIGLILAILHRAESSYRQVVGDIERLALSKRLDTIAVMISPTVEGLALDRDAAARAIDRLGLTEIRAEMFGSRPESRRKFYAFLAAAARAIAGLGLIKIQTEKFESRPESLRNIYAFLAEQCDLLILIIGERYEALMELEGNSVLEFVYQIAHAQSPQKILVYVKDGINREPRLQDFLMHVRDAEHTCVTSFTTPEDLYEDIQRGIARWLTSHVKQQQPKHDN